MLNFKKFLEAFESELFNLTNKDYNTRVRLGKIREEQVKDSIREIFKPQGMTFEDPTSTQDMNQKIDGFLVSMFFEETPLTPPIKPLPTVHKYKEKLKEYEKKQKEYEDNLKKGISKVSKVAKTTRIPIQIKDRRGQPKSDVVFETIRNFDENKPLNSQIKDGRDFIGKSVITFVVMNDGLRIVEVPTNNIKTLVNEVIENFSKSSSGPYLRRNYLDPKTGTELILKGDKDRNGNPIMKVIAYVPPERLAGTKVHRTNLIAN